ncbi:MAG: PKD domain-containing protein [Prolixibacteraceae bacterium]
MNRLIRYRFASCLWTWCFIVLFAGTTVAQSPIEFAIQGATVLEKDTFTIAVQANSELTGEDVYAFRFGISYNADYLEFQGIDSVGSVLSDWGIPTFSNKKRGKIVIAGAGTTPLSGNGNMIYLRFKALRGGGTYVSTISGESYLNEGSPLMTMSNGYINATYRSYPDIYNDNYQLFVGDEAQMYVSGGTAPYTFGTVDSDVAVISNSTMVKGKGPGLTKAFVTDANGEISYTSGNIDVRAIKMSVIQSSAWPTDTFYLPVKIEIAPGTKVYSGYFELTFNTNVQGIKESVQTGDFDISVQNNAVTNLVRVSFASGAGIAGTGILCYIGFKAINSGNHYFNFQNMKFNENLLAFDYQNYVEVFYLPTLNISPNSGTLMWGATQKITVTNGSPPLTYSVSNPSLASIDELGNLSALSGGIVKVTATDSHGATKTSGDFTILDNQFSIINTDGDLDHITRVPISTSPLPSGKVIYDFDGTISFVENDLEFIGLDPAGPDMLTEFVQTGNSVHIVGASSVGIPSGIICYLKFKIKNTVAIDGQTTISLNSLSANESSLFSTTESGKIKRVFQVSYRPVANAGINKTVSEGTVVQLDGSGSYDEDGNPITYLWTAPAGITLDDNTLQKPSFTAPEVNVNTIYNFTLVVNDGTDDSDPSTVKITVLQINKRPVANAGPDASYNEGSSVSLDGSLSSDPDGDVISYKWTSLDGIILFDALGVSPSFNAPQVNADKNYRFKLEVADGVLTSFADTVVIKVVNLNKKPVAFAGGDQTVNEGALVNLDGSLSADADGETITFKWTAPDNVVLSSETASNPSFTAPMVHLDSVLVFTLVVNDGHVDSDPDNVSITVKNLNILSTEAQILSSTLTGADSVKVNQALLQVILYLPYGTNPTALAPNFQISPKASIVPAGGSIRNFTAPVLYTVTAEDGITKKVYSVQAFVPTVTLKRTLEAGWNWISLGSTPSDLKVSSVLGSLALENPDYIKSATTSAVYFPATGWFGDLVNLPQLEMLMFKKATSEVFTLNGKEINPSLVTIPVSTGWNRIGYILKGNSKLAEAFEPASLPTGEILLKSKAASAIYYPASGWVGDLDSLRVLNGYMMKTAANSNLKYKAESAKLKSASLALFSLNNLHQAYQIYPPSFEFSANLIGDLLNPDGQQVVRKGDLLIARSGNEPRGVAEACFVPDLNRYVFILTMFSNVNQEKLNFRIKSLNSDYEQEISDELAFANDEVFGQAMNPYPLHLKNATGIPESVSNNSLSVFPNPVKNELQIRSEDKIISVTISGLSGNCIQILKNVPENFILINTQNLVSGMYILKIETSGGTFIRKLIKSTS